MSRRSKPHCSSIRGAQSCTPGASVTRRAFLKIAGAAAVAAGCSRSVGRVSQAGQLDRMIVLGIDGMDPVLLERFVAQGLLPNCAKLMQSGSFKRLGTSNPPQSPVAWSNFISGTNPGGHGIFDFIARDPATMAPYHSTTQMEPAGGALKVGRWAIPTAPGRIINRRHGPTFWEDLERAGVDCTIFRMPANFPPTESEATSLSGMGTPDLQGGYGSFTWFTDDPKARDRDVNGGRIERITVENDTVVCTLRGPVNDFAADREPASVSLTVYRDAERRAARVIVQGTDLVLREGEWSDWIVVRFAMLPGVVDLSGIVRIYLKSVREPFGLYVSPVNIDPANPSLPISTPPDYSRRLVREVGYFYTQGIVEDTNAFSAGVLDAAEFREQAMFVHDERLRFFEHELARFDRGFLFYYFSTLDLSSHVFWRTIDPGHPLYSRELAESQGDFLAVVYKKVDEAIGKAFERLDGRGWLMVMSDHGFTSFRRQFNLNSWLLDNGFLRTRSAPVRNGSTLFQDVDWSKSRAYGVGLNGLYLNLEGRESSGRVRRGDEARRMAEELARRLQAVIDPDTGEKVIAKVHAADDIYSGPHAADGPDLIVGYNRHYRASWDTILGGFPRQHVLDNTDVWSGDHCIDPSFVPGVLLSSRPLQTQGPRLEDLAPTILAAFDVKTPEEMTGRQLT